MKTFDIPEIYKSSLIAKIKENRRLSDKLKKDFSPTILKFKNLEILIARHFGFCFGVENAVEIAYKTLEENKNKKVFLLSEMIHNPDVNADLLSRGVRFLMDTSGNRLVDFATLRPEDIVIVPAFGTTVEIQSDLSNIGINPYQFDTTCPFVEKVWNKASQIGERGFSIIVHGKPEHEETRATFSHSQEKTPTVVIKDIKEAAKLAKYIRNEKSSEQFFEEFKGRYSKGFNPEKDLIRFGVVNQTTMLAVETQEIADYLKNVVVEYRSLEDADVQKHFASTRDTLCYATNDNQDATYELLKHEVDFAIVVGGYNSSNTTHLVELLETKHKTFFIESAKMLNDENIIHHFDIHTQKETSTENYLPNNKPLRIILTCGASCPDSVVENVLNRILEINKIVPLNEKTLETALNSTI